MRSHILLCSFLILLFIFNPWIVFGLIKALAIVGLVVLLMLVVSPKRTL